MIESFRNAMLEWGNNVRQARAAHEFKTKHIELGKAISEALATGLENSDEKLDGVRDERYNEPKGKPKATKEEIDAVIENTEIYKQAKEYILNAAQPEQVGYGIDKYPEPLNADTWTIIETIDHIISESVDKLHYLVMLRIKLLRLNGDEATSVENAKSDGNVKHQPDTAYPNMTLEKGKVEPKSVNDIRREFKIPIFPAYGCDQPGPVVDESNKTKTDIRNFQKETTDCHVKIGSEYYPAKFIEVFQYSDVIVEHDIHGTSRGVVAYPVAVVRHGSKLKQVKLTDMVFEENVI